MKHKNIQHERESDRKNAFNSYLKTTQGMVMKRLLLLIITIFMVFAGALSTPTSKASAPCDIVCNEIVDPDTGQCFVVCCPTNEACKIRCTMFPCKQ